MVGEQIYMLDVGRSRPGVNKAKKRAYDLVCLICLLLECAPAEKVVAIARKFYSRGDLRANEPSAPPQLGVIDRVLAEQGYGFILTDAGERVYFHRSAVRGGLEFERLGEGDRVGLNFEAGERGLQATVVRPAPPDAPVP